MIDIHTHILPGIDDGSQHLEESLEMARIAVSEGITTLIATPHHANGRYTNEADSVTSNVRALSEALQAASIPLNIVPGQEVRVYKDLLEDLESGKLLTLNRSQYLLIEFPSSRIPTNIAELIHELRLQGITPIIAHPERNAEIADQPNRLYELIQLGALSQLTSHSLIGQFGSKIQKLSMQLCEHNLVHFLSSDAHNLEHRPFKLQEAHQVILKTQDDKYSDYFVDNAQLLLDNRRITIWQPKPIKSKKWFKIW